MGQSLYSNKFWTILSTFWKKKLFFFEKMTARAKISKLTFLIPKFVSDDSEQLLKKKVFFFNFSPPPPPPRALFRIFNVAWAWGPRSHGGWSIIEIAQCKVGNNCICASVAYFDHPSFHWIFTLEVGWRSCNSLLMKTWHGDMITLLLFQVPFKTVGLLPFKINKNPRRCSVTNYVSLWWSFLSHVKLNFRNLTYHPIQKN